MNKYELTISNYVNQESSSQGTKYDFWVIHLIRSSVNFDKKLFFY